MAKFSNLFLKESKDPITEMEFTPHGGVVTPIPVPASNSTTPGPTAVGHIEHPAPGLTEPKTVVTKVPSSLAKPLSESSEYDAASKKAHDASVKADEMSKSVIKDKYEDGHYAAADLHNSAAMKHAKAYSIAHDNDLPGGHHDAKVEHHNKKADHHMARVESIRMSQED